MSNWHLAPAGQGGPSAPRVGEFSALLEEIAPRPKTRLSAADRAMNEYENSRKHGHQDGYAAGYEDGLAAGRRAGFAAAHETAAKECAETLAQFQSDLRHVDELVREGMDQWFAKAEVEVEGLVTAIAREVMKKELEISRTSVISIVRAALGEVTMSREARIRVNPLDLLSLASAKKDLLTASQGLRSIELVDDPTILGGCVVETGGGVVDATVEGQLARLEEAA